MAKKICFVMPEMYPLLDTSVSGHSGGSEAQMLQVAKALSKKGHDVSVIVGDYGQPKRRFFEGIETLRINNRRGPKPWRIIYSIINIFFCLWQKKPDVVLHQNFGYFHGILALLCRALGISYVYFTASQGDIDGTRYRSSSRFIAWLWLMGMKITPTIIVQTHEHQDLLQQHFSRQSIVIPNGIDTKSFSRTQEHGNSILWIAHWRQVKRPDLVGELARQLPNYKFVMCGGFYDNALYDRISPTLPSNVNIRGHVTSFDLNNAYQDAMLLINTSDYEGIPITFDEAWACELPVVSLNVDPDGVIARHALGAVSKNIEQMLKDIKLLCEDKRKLIEIGSNCRSFVVKNHNIEVVAEKIEGLIYAQN